jgi:hypothetical protein
MPHGALENRGASFFPRNGKTEFRKQNSEFLSISKFRPEYGDEDEDRIKARSVHMTSSIARHPRCRDKTTACSEHREHGDGDCQRLGLS